MDAWFTALAVVCAIAIPVAVVGLCLGVVLELRDWIRGRKRRPAPPRRKRPASAGRRSR